MAKTKKSSAKHNRAIRRFRVAAIQMAILGMAMALLPLFVTSLLWAGLAKSSAPFGWALCAAGLLLLWFSRPSGDKPVSSSVVSTGHVDLVARTSLQHKTDIVRTVPTASASLGTVPLQSTVRKRPSEWSREVFLQIEWRRFEALIETLFAQAGFETRAQALGADGGVDVWLYAKGREKRPVSIVQCKQWTGKSVGVDKIRELRGVMASHNLTRGQFATTSNFTPDAVTFANANGVNLLNVDALLALIERRSPEQREALLKVALEGDYWRPTCVIVERKWSSEQSVTALVSGAALVIPSVAPRCKFAPVICKPQREFPQTSNRRFDRHALKCCRQLGFEPPQQLVSFATSPVRQ